MADLSTLDDTQPLSTDLVSQGDDKIRETRTAVKTSFAVEHALTGEHAFPSGNAASRPSAGNTGSIYINTENEWVELDDGSSLVQLGAVGLFYDNQASSTAVASYPSYTNIVTPFSVTHRTNSRVLITISFQATSSSSTMQLAALVTFGATTLLDTVTSGRIIKLPVGEAAINSYQFVQVPGTNGSTTLTCQLTTLGGTNTFADAYVTALVV